MTPTRHPLVEQYLAALRGESGRLDPADAAELLGDVEAHLAESVPADASDVEARNALERLGRPAELIAEALGERGAPAADLAQDRGSGWPEALAIFALLGAELLAPLYFFSVPLWIVGIVCLAIAKRWSTQLKLRGFIFLGLGLPLAWVVLISATVATSRCMTVSSDSAGSITESQTTCAGASPWVGYLVLALLAVFFVFQVLTARKLARASRQ
jgi:uncharacterized membrane protein